LKSKQIEREKIKKQMERALDKGKTFFNDTAHRMMGYESGDCRFQIVTVI